MSKTKKLFYSYSHYDTGKRSDMAASLALLKDEGLISEWYDGEIVPGEKFAEVIQQKMSEADIICFLVSRHFLNSEACRKEWVGAVEIAQSRNDCFLVPIILETCDWKNLAGMKEHLALPDNGKPIEGFAKKSRGWQQVTEGIRRTVSRLNQIVRPKDTFVTEQNRSDFLSKDRELVSLSDIFIFPKIEMEGDELNEKVVIKSTSDILKHNDVLIVGEERSGKSALLKHLFLELADARTPVLYVVGA